MVNPHGHSAIKILMGNLTNPLLGQLTFGEGPTGQAAVLGLDLLDEGPILNRNTLGKVVNT